MSRMSSRAPTLRVLATIGCLTVVLILLVHALEYRSFFADDGFISLRYAKRFIQGHGLTWSDGERVEGYTNFLWIVLVASVGWITRQELVTIARVIGMASAATALLAVVFCGFPRKAGQLLPNLAVASAVALYGPFATWAIGGLEQPLLAALVAWALVLSRSVVDRDRSTWRHIMPASVLFALAALTRPDALLFVASAATGLVVARCFRARAFVDALRLSTLPLITSVMHVAFRRYYYGDWVPNTFHVKVVLSWDRMNQGWTYVSSNPGPGLALLAPLVVATMGAICDTQVRKRLVLVAVPLLVWVGYVITVGGDIMPRHRHLVPAAVLVAIMDVEGLAFLAKRGRFRVVLANALAVMLVAGVLCSQANDPSKARVLAEQWEWRGRPVGNFLRRHFASFSPLLAVDAAGATPYYAEIDALDMLGLNDRYLALHPPANFGKGWLGHELGDSKYFLQRKPDLVLFARPPGARVAMWRAGREMQRSQEFRKFYKLVAIDTGGQDAEVALIWVRYDDGRVGVVRSKDRIAIPGYLLSTDSGPVAKVNAMGKLGTPLKGKDIGHVPSIMIPEGVWRVRTEADGDPVLRAGLSGRVGDSKEGREVRLAVPVIASQDRQSVTLDVFVASSDAAHVRSITLDRLVDEEPQ